MNPYYMDRILGDTFSVAFLQLDLWKKKYIYIYKGIKIGVFLTYERVFLLLKINWAWLGRGLVLNSISGGYFNFIQDLFGNIILGVENGYVFDTLINMISFLLEIVNDFEILMTPYGWWGVFHYWPFVLWDFQKHFSNEFKNFFLSIFFLFLFEYFFLFLFVIPLLRD